MVGLSVHSTQTEPVSLLPRQPAYTGSQSCYFPVPVTNETTDVPKQDVCHTFSPMTARVGHALMPKRCARVGSNDFNAFPGPIPGLPLQMAVNSRFPSYQDVFSGRTELQVMPRILHHEDDLV